MAVMAKHGEPGWFFDRKICSGWVRLIPNDPVWSPDEIYRAVRVERNAGRRVPLPWSTVKCGMVVRYMLDIWRLVTEVRASGIAIAGQDHCFTHTDIKNMYHLDGDTWKPLWTEEPGEEKIVEIVSEEET